MGCSGAYAAAWEFTAFWCANALLSRAHDGANNSAVLSDSQAQFVTRGVRANVGMMLYNLTDGSSGVVTALTETTLTATLTGGIDNDWDTSDVYRITTMDAGEIATVGYYLDIVANDLHAALAAQGACDCTLSTWGAGLLKKLNIIEAGAMYSCSCGSPHLTDAQRQTYFDWMNTQTELLRTGKIDVCQGATGSEYPAFGAAELALTDFAAGQIVANRWARTRR
jgi:hypothetical protein